MIELATSTTSRTAAAPGRVVAAVIAGSLVLGGLTSVAQAVLPDSLRSLANSPSGWTLLTVVLIAVARLRLLPAAVLGAASFVSLVLGYTLVSELRGLSYSPVFWGATGVLAGPIVGWSTSAALDRRPLLGAVGSSLIAAVLLTDAIYGLTVVADTTSPVYWWVVGVAGLVFLGVVAMCRRLPARYVAVQVGSTLIWVVIGSARYVLLNGIRGA